MRIRMSWMGKKRMRTRWETEWKRVDRERPNPRHITMRRLEAVLTTAITTTYTVTIFYLFFCNTVTVTTATTTTTTTLRRGRDGGLG